MADIIKIYIKETSENWRLDLIKAGEENLFQYDSNSPLVELGGSSYDFEMEIWLKNTSGETDKKHTVNVSQDESNSIIRPGLPGRNSTLNLPKETQPVSDKSSSSDPQDESNTIIRPGKLPGSKDLFKG